MIVNGDDEDGSQEPSNADEVENVEHSILRRTQIRGFPGESWCDGE